MQQDRNLGKLKPTIAPLNDAVAALEQRLSERREENSGLPCETARGEVTLTLGPDEVAALRRILTAVAQRDAGLEDGAKCDPAMLVAEIMCDTREARANLFPASMFSEPAWDILLALYITDEEPAASDLARRTDIAASTVWRWLAYLEGHKLIAREESAHDKRAHKIRLTDEARKNLQELFASVANRFNHQWLGARPSHG